MKSLLQLLLSCFFLTIFLLRTYVVYGTPFVSKESPFFLLSDYYLHVTVSDSDSDSNMVRSIGFFLTLLISLSSYYFNNGS